MGTDGLIRVNDPRNARLTILDPDLGPVREARLEVLSFGFIWAAVAGSDGRTLETTLATLGGEISSAVKVYDAEGRWTDTIPIEPFVPTVPGAPQSGTIRMQTATGGVVTTIPFWPTGIRLLDPRGFFWVKPAGSNDYHVARMTFEGDTVLVIEGGRRARPLLQAQRDSAAAGFRESFEGAVIDASDIPTESPLIRALLLDDRGRLWVQVDASDEGTTYDIFGEDGRYEGSAFAPIRIPFYLLPSVVDDRFYAIETGEFGVEYVVRAEIRDSGVPR